MKTYIAGRVHKLAGIVLGLLALAAAFTVFVPAARAENARVAAKPLMWVIKDADSTIYLFGSIHVMRDDIYWLTPELRQKFESADSLWLEIPNLDDSMAMIQTVQKYSANPANNMTEGLSDAEVERINQLAAPYGGSAKQLMGVRKWAVGLFLTTQKIASLGYNPRTGVDVTLLNGARYFGKDVQGLETMDEQMQALVPANDAEDIKALRETLSYIDGLPADLPPLVKAWVEGDEAALTRLLDSKMKAKDPAGYQRVVINRNAAWEPKIEAILAGKGTTFIAVGTAHLVGPDSVIAMLKARGIVAQKIN